MSAYSDNLLKNSASTATQSLLSQLLPGGGGMLPLSLSAGGGGPSGASATNGISFPINIPFNFDHSGWNVNIKGEATQSATGNKDANGAQQSQPSILGSLMGGGNMLPLMIGGIGLLMFLRR